MLGIGTVTLDSGIDVWHEMKVGPGKFEEKNTQGID